MGMGMFLFITGFFMGLIIGAIFSPIIVKIGEIVKNKANEEIDDINK